MDTAAPSSSGPRVVARGYLDEFSATAVLQALSISRQFTAVELFTREGRLEGRVFLKAGMVLGVQLAGEPTEGVEAFRRLMNRPLHTFQVARLAPPEKFPEPIGRLTAALLAMASDATGGHSLSERPQSNAAEAIPLPASKTSVGRSDTAAVRVSERKLGMNSTSIGTPEHAPVTRTASAGGFQHQSPPSAGTRNLSPVPQMLGAESSGQRVPVVAIVSPKGGCGKTTIAVNVAVSLAQSGLRVVLVDTDPNGDTLSAVAARQRVTLGVFDALGKHLDPATLAIRTALEGLRIIPAMGPGPELPLSLGGGFPSSTAWRRVFCSVSADADIVVVDTSAGMFGVSAHVFGACTHVMGVLQAESISSRSFSIFSRVLHLMERPPSVIGVVLNMFRRSHGASVSILIDAANELPDGWLFDTTIPYSDVFLASTEQGMPVGFVEGVPTSGVTLLFNALAAEMRARLGMLEPTARKHFDSFVS